MPRFELLEMERYRRLTVQTRRGCPYACILGLDGTGEESFDEVFDFVQQSGLYEVQVTLQTPFPGTRLYQELAAEGRLLSPEAWEKCTLFDLNFQPQQMSVQQLEHSFRQLLSRLYSDEFTENRRSNFRRALRRHS